MKSEQRMTYNVPWNLRVMKALSALTLKCNVTVSEDTVDEVIHGRFLKFAACSCFAAECGRALDFLLQKITDV
jgi:hypothetical protein